MMVKKISIFIPIIVLLVIFNCKKEDQLKKANIQTISIEVKNDSIYLNGNIINSESNKIDSSGFVISSNKNPTINSQVFFSKKKDDKGNFTITIVDNFKKDSIYFVRAFFQSEGYVFYGNEVSFISKNLNLPKIEDFSPIFGIDNEYVKIYGSNFSNNVNDVSVFFGSKQAEIISCSLNRILVKIPPYSNSENCFISVKVKSNQAISSKAFFLYGPVINNFSPVEGNGEMTITINGNYFSGIRYRNTVLIGTYVAEIVEASEKMLIVRSDLSNFLPGSYHISVVANDKTAISNSTLNVISPWKQLAYLPIPGISGAPTFRINNKIYLCTGTTNWLSTGGYSKLFLEYDIITNTWKRKADFPGVARNRAVGFSVGDKGYIGLGVSFVNDMTLYPSDFWEYNSSTDSWTQKSDFPGGGRENSMGFTYSNKGFILMGRNIGGQFADFWSYDPGADKWQSLPDFISKGISRFNIAILNDKLYIIGGEDSYSFKNEIWKFDLITNEWSFVIQYSFNPIFTFYGNNKCYIMDTNLKLFEYFPESNSLKMMPIFPGSKRILVDRGSGLIFNGKIYYGTGCMSGFGECLNDFWSFDLN